MSIQSNRLTGLNNLEFAANHLKELYVSHNGLTSLSGLEFLSQLQILDISNNTIQILSPVSKLVNLVELWASNNRIESFDEVRTECSHLLLLETVYFEGNPLQQNNVVTYRNKIKLAIPHIKQIDATLTR